MDETGAAALDLRTGRGVLRAEDAGDGLIRVNMGPPQLDWDEVPLARAMDLDALPLAGGPGAVGMGNPHCVFVVPDAEAVDVAAHRRRASSTTRCSPSAPTSSSSRWSTARRSACGSGSAAAWSRSPAARAPARRRWSPRAAAWPGGASTVRLDGGELGIDWRDDGVWMTGPTALVFEGRLSADFSAALA